MTSIDVVSWIQLLLLGGIMGAIGQGIRVIVGLKKMNDAAASSPASTSDLILPSRLIVSLIIGFIAGALAATQIVKNIHGITTEQIFAIAAAGYAGADFIEGFMTRVTPAANVAAGETAVGTGTGTSSGGAGSGDSAATGQPAPLASATNADGTVG